jgi:hypothetical protein
LLVLRQPPTERPAARTPGTSGAPLIPNDLLVLRRAPH